MRVFISYSSSDRNAVRALVDGLKQIRPDWDPFFDQYSLRTGYWMPQLAKGVEGADAFVFLFGDRLGPWQTIEYYGAFDKRVKDAAIPIVPVLMQDAPIPGLPFLEQLQWLQTPDLVGQDSIAQVAAALERPGRAEQSSTWRYVDPYRGLKALREEDSALLFGRDDLVIDLINSVAMPSGKVTMAVGNSGIGKSSLIFAGVLAALERQGWISRQISAPWPAALAESRTWVRLKLAPREDPLRQLARTFVAQWMTETDASYHDELDKWEARLIKRDSRINDLLIAADAGARAKGVEPPAKYVLYVDQGEELYTRSDPEQARRFSQLLAQAAETDRCRVLMSIRSDFYGKLQEDAVLLAASNKFDIPPLSKAGLREVVEAPANRFSAQFEPGLVETLISAAFDAPSGLPLLSYQMDALWSDMIARDDGTLRPPPMTREFEIASALIEKADGYLAAHPDLESATRRLFCARLAHVPQQGPPTRQVALYQSLSADEKRVVEDLSGPEYRLISTGENEDGDATVEVGHETLLTSWSRLRNWIEDRRAFYAWLTDIQADRASYDNHPERKALLMGRRLETAKLHLQAYPADIPGAEKRFVEESEKAERKDNRIRATVRWTFLSVLIAGLVGLAAMLNWAIEQRRDGLEFQSQILADKVFELIEQEQYEKAMLVGLEAWREEGTGPLRLIERWIRPERMELTGAMRSLLFNETTRFQKGELPESDSILGFYSEVSSDGRFVLVSGPFGPAIVFDIMADKQVLQLDEDLIGMDGAVFSSDGRFLLSGSEETVRVWEVDSGRLVHTLVHDRTGIVARDVSPDGRYIVTSSFYDIFVWDARTGLKIHHADTDRPLSLTAFAQDGNYGVFGADGGLLLFDYETGRTSSLIDDVGDDIDHIVYSPDRQFVLTAHGDGTASLFKLETGERIMTYGGHTGRITGAIFSIDGRFVITTGWENTVRFFDTMTGRSLFSVHDDSAIGFSVTALSDGISYITVGGDEWLNLKLSDQSLSSVDQDQWEIAELVRQRVTRCLTLNEREQYQFDVNPPNWCAGLNTNTVEQEDNSQSDAPAGE
ncbi:MAG: TIR domain-containing protein [Pseudomonadota bacterium]